MIANEKKILMPSTKPITLFINGKKVCSFCNLKNDTRKYLMRDCAKHKSFYPYLKFSVKITVQAMLQTVLHLI